MTNHFYNTSKTYLDILEQSTESNFKMILDTIQLYANEGSVLEYGCGTGQLSVALAKRGYTVTGIDISEQFIASAKNKCDKLMPVLFEVMDELPLRFADDSFDIITTHSVLEHCTDIDSILLEFKRLLKTNGLLVISTPNMLSPLSRLKLIADRLTGRRKDFHRFGTPRFFFMSCFYLIKKIITRKPEFIYVDPDYNNFSDSDTDVSYLSNHLDYLFFLRSHGFTVLELSRNTGIIKKFISKYLPYISGGVAIVARKK